MARLGYGTIYRIWDASLTVPALVDLAEVTSITPPESTADRIDATHMQSPDRRREYISGLIDSGSASIEIQWEPGNDTDVLIRGLLTSGAKVQHEIEFPNGVTVSFDAVITGFSKAIPVDDKMTATIEVAPSGAETWGTAA